MHWLRFAVLLILAMILQAELVSAIAVSDLDIKPDLMVILLVFFGLRGEPKQAIIASFAIGFASDIIGAGMGPGTISFGLLGSVLAYVRRSLSIKSMPLQAAVIFVAACATTLLANLLSLLQSQPPPRDTIGVLAATAFYSAIVGPFLFLPIAWWMRIKADRQRRR